MASRPAYATPNPMIEPTIEWVVETGHPMYEANCSHAPAASNDASMPSMNADPSPAKIVGSTMPLRTVSDTCEPTRKAPANSRRAARITARRSVSAPEPTDVPMALATSFAPMPHAM